MTGLAVARALLLGEPAAATPPVQLPVPCAAGACAPNATPGFGTAPGGFVTFGNASAIQNGNSLTIQQQSNQAILNWQSFNIGAGGTVTFQQPNSTAIALNKIYQDSPSAIFGNLSANGQIYLINPNGFVFGSGARINVAGLVASSLGLTNGDQELADGLLSAVARATPTSALSSDNRIYVTDSLGNLVLDANGKPQPVQISVQQGAQITAADGGRLLLAGQNVTNAGTLTAPDGQVALAAGQQVYLAASGDPALRGLLVEVNNNGIVDPNVGNAANQAGGTLSAPRGNVSLLGLAVNQSGRISATTTVSSNGSVVLKATQGGATSCGPGEVICSTQGGKLTLGTTSEIDVLPEYSDTTTAAVAQTQIQSSIQLTGQQVFIQGGQINAPGGNLNVLAATNPDHGLNFGTYDPSAELRVAAGTSINLAGSNATVPMSSNLVSIQLNSNELEDSPLQRTGALKGKTVIVDVRNGKPAIISESSWLSTLQGIQENIAQRTSAGGSASFKSVGDVVVNPNATIDVSGGKWTYTGGVSQTSQLLGANGKSYEISSADPNLTYVGVINPTYTTNYNGFGIQITSPTPGLARYNQGYTQGFSAGGVTFAAPAMSMQGTLIGKAVNGIYQRGPAPAESLMGYLSDPTGTGANGSGGIALGGTLTIGDTTYASGSAAAGGLASLYAPGVIFSNTADPVIIADGAALPPQLLQLSPSYITSGGFTQTNIFSDSTVTLPAGLPLNLGAGGTLQVTAPRINIDSNITALGGSIAFKSEDTLARNTIGAPTLGISVGTGVTLDVSGQWTNDLSYAGGTSLGVLYRNGGTISLALTPPPVPESGGELVLGDGVNLLANGGAWLNPSGSLSGGKGGTIDLDASPWESALQVGRNVNLAAFGVQGAQGGTFSLAVPVINVSQGDGTWAAAQRADYLPPDTPDQTDATSAADAEPKAPPAFELGSALFSKYGFSKVSLTATDPLELGATSTDLLTVAAGTAIDARAQSLQLTPGFQTRHSGGTVQSFSTALLLPDANRNPYTVNLAVAPTTHGPLDTVGFYGDLNIEAGASIVADPGSTITLGGQGSIRIDGVLRAPGGSITARISGPSDKIQTNDYGFQASQALELGATGVLDVSGTAVFTPNDLGLRLGKVYGGGTVSLEADRGVVNLDAGSVVNIAGGSAVLDVQRLNGSGGYGTATMGAAAGTLSLTSGESISLLGTLVATPGASSAGKLEGGTLEVSLDQSLTNTTLTAPGPESDSYRYYHAFPLGAPTIELVSTTAGSSPTASYGNQAVLGISQIEQAGFDVLALRAAGDKSGTIAINTSTPLSMGREISFDAPYISVAYGTNASINAPYVSFTDTNLTVTTPVALGGAGSLSVTAAQIALSGPVALQGAGSATFTSSGDIELEPLAVQHIAAGSLAAAGNLTLNAARIYPSTYAAYTIDDPYGNVTIGQTSASPGTPLSAGGALTINADTIYSSGTILAPFGTITLNGTSSVELAANSVTSVSADGAVIPYGQTVLNQGEWIAGLPDATKGVDQALIGQITLNAPKVSFDKGATVDLSGGGDLSAYEWVPGTGGSVDVLNQTPGLYAIVPSLGGSYAAFDAQRFGTTAGTPGVGASVYLSGMPGLPAGVYTLLPASYALSSPGAYLVQVESGYTSLDPGTIGHLSNGAPVVAGYLTFGNTGLQASSGYQGFAIYPGNYSQTLAQYDVAKASTFFSAAAAAAAAAGKAAITLPADAATLLIKAGTELTALGSVNSAAGDGGTAATIEISADNLTVTRSDGDKAADGGVAIGAPTLKSWNAGDLILGGEFVTDATTGAVSLDVVANNVTIAQGAQISANQVIAVANTSIDVQSGATLASNSGVSGAALPTLPGAETITLSGTNPLGAALLAVSDSNLVLAGRPSLTDPTAPPPATQANINVESGATLATRGAVSLDSPAGMTIDGAINAPGASWSLASNGIAFVGPGSPSIDSLPVKPTLQINSDLLAQMQSAGALQLLSAGSIDLLTNVSLGATNGSAPTLGALTLIGSSINNCDGCNAVLGGKTVTLAGIGGDGTTATGGTGTMTIIANTLNLGGTGDSDFVGGNLALNGNSQTTVQVSGAVVGQGNSKGSVNTVAFSGDVSMAAAELTAASRTGTAIALSDGTLTISQNGTADSAASLASSLGGHLSLTANAIADSGSIIAPGGTISLAATGNITLGSGATIDTRGITVSVGTQSEGAAGGIVNVTAGGDLALASGATINVSGAGAAPGGTISLVGVGNVTADATFLGNAAKGVTGGSFSLEAGTLSGGLSPGLVSNLTNGGFNNQIGIEVHNGDLDLAAGESLTANNITLVADTGAVNVGGSLTATAGGQSGYIGLFGGTSVSLLSGGKLTANGIASSGHGGTVELSSTCLTCTVNLASGSTIVTNGGADGGELLLEAPVYGTNDVAINIGQNGLGADVGGVGKIIIESVLPTFSETNATIAANLASDVGAAASYLSGAAPVIGGRLNSGGSSKITVQAGVDIEDADSTETLVLPALDLTAYSSPYSGGTPRVIDLTVRAAGGLTIGGPITDGYDANNGGLYTAGADSGSFRFVAGADLSSANPLATAYVPPGSSGATLTVGGLVSTGTGNIGLAASGDVNFLAGSSVYTTGTQARPTKNIGGDGNPTYLDFATGGGNVSVMAGQDVDGVIPSDDVSVAYWQGRDASGGTSGLAEWGVKLTAFDLHPWVAATFGGGDVSIVAGRDVSRVTVATADSLALSADGASQTRLPGGGLVVGAGRDVISSEFFAADGVATLTAGRSFATVSTGATDPLGSTFYVQNSQVSLWAQGEITISGILNPTIQTLSPSSRDPLFWSYGAQASFSAQSAAGDIDYFSLAGGNDANLKTILGTTIATTGMRGHYDRLGIATPSLRLVSLTQDINIAAGTLYPSTTGQLQLFAGKDIGGKDGTGGGQVFMSDAPANILSTVANVISGGGGTPINGASNQVYDFFANLHADDATPAVIVAGEDINNLTLSIPKAADIEAGRDITNLTFYGENLNASDITLISAGRDFKDPTQFDPTGAPMPSSTTVQVGGPGSLMLLAGRDIDLGFSDGVTTVGALKNPNLPTADGASITMVAGLGDNLNNPNYSAFYQQIIATSSAYQQQLVNYVESITGESDLSTEQADHEFLAFSPEKQRSLIDSVFFNELNVSGVEANHGGGYTRGYSAVDALFPGSRSGTPGSSNNPYSGDISLTYSQIYTEQGGGISLLAPGGSLNVGLAVPPAIAGLPKAPSQLGIVAEGVGDVDIYTKSDVNVNSSRVFTLGGGDILIWSDEGNIDAGKGSKTSLSAPPPTFAIDAQGNVITTFGAAVAGSGIRTIKTNPSQAAGNVNLVAPKGFVNAGEAGIVASGNVNIAALAVLNATNINFGGTGTGVPPPVSANIAAVASAASAASSATTSVTSGLDDSATKDQAAPLTQTAISWLDVFVSGLGEENCKPEDAECLKRQKQE